MTLRNSLKTFFRVFFVFSFIPTPLLRFVLQQNLLIVIRYIIYCVLSRLLQMFFYKLTIIYMGNFNIIEKKNDNKDMNSVFYDLVRILKFVEKQLDKEIFDYEKFNSNHFGISENRFAKLLQLLENEKLISGIEVRDYGEKDETCGANYKRYAIIADSPTITISGLKFIAENSLLSQTFNTIKNIKDIVK